MKEVDERDAEIEALRRRVEGLENEARKWRSRAFYAEGALAEAEATVCPMSQGDPHNTCSLAEALADTLGRACARDPTLSDWLDETAEDANPDPVL